MSVFNESLCFTKSGLTGYSFLFFEAQWVLVFFPSEDAVLVVKTASVVSPPLEMLKKGDVCRVKERNVTHEAQFVKIGRFCLLSGLTCFTCIQLIF